MILSKLTAIFGMLAAVALADASVASLGKAVPTGVPNEPSIWIVGWNRNGMVASIRSAYLEPAGIQRTRFLIESEDGVVVESIQRDIFEGDSPNDCDAICQTPAGFLMKYRKTIDSLLFLHSIKCRRAARFVVDRKAIRRFRIEPIAYSGELELPASCHQGGSILIHGKRGRRVEMSDSNWVCQLPSPGGILRNRTGKGPEILLVRKQNEVLAPVADGDAQDDQYSGIVLVTIKRGE